MCSSRDAKIEFAFEGLGCLCPALRDYDDYDEAAAAGAIVQSARLARQSAASQQPPRERTVNSRYCNARVTVFHNRGK